MDLRTAAKPRTPNTLLGIPDYILNTFFPGILPLLARSPRIAKLLSLVLALWWLGPSVFWPLKRFLDNISSFFISSVSVNSDEDLFEYLVRWLATRRTIRMEHSLVASLSKSSHDQKERSYYHEISPPEDLRSIEVQYEATHGLQWLSYKKRPFLLRKAFSDGTLYNGRKSQHLQTLTLSCLGRSTQPIKDFLEQVYREHKDKEKSLTIIRRPYVNEYGRNAWSRISQKPRRAMDTVILKTTQKNEVISDIEAYLDPPTQAWYGARGIPYRRGYLFHGEPGTGKTSLAMAIAGRFGLDIYVISLLDSKIEDSPLISLFNMLPPKCLLLLEDIDTVGLARKPSSRRQNASQWPTALADIEDEDDDKEEEEKKRQPLSRVSLSGLLNAIDGVAAPEGHILIMTTNKPEELDEALIRSGRISVRVCFEKATSEQAREIFVRMYRHEEEDGSRKSGFENEVPAKTGGYAHLEELARQFGERVPDYLFSPADLQDFLLSRRKDPQLAMDQMEEWKTTIMAEQARIAEDEANRRKDKAERKKRKMAEMLALSGEMASAMHADASQSHDLPLANDEVKEASQESTAADTTADTAADIAEEAVKV